MLFRKENRKHSKDSDEIMYELEHQRRILLELRSKVDEIYCAQKRKETPKERGLRENI